MWQKHDWQKLFGKTSTGTGGGWGWTAIKYQCSSYGATCKNLHFTKSRQYKPSLPIWRHLWISPMCYLRVIELLSIEDEPLTTVNAGIQNQICKCQNSFPVFAESQTGLVELVQKLSTNLKEIHSGNLKSGWVCWILNGRKEVGLQMVRISNGI